MKVLIAAAAASILCASLATAASAAAPAAAGNHDVQCFIAASQVALSDDQDTKTKGMIASMFFAGKIFGAHPSINLKAALAAEAGRMDKIDMQGLLKECATEMQTRGDQIQAAGDALQAQGK